MLCFYRIDPKHICGREAVAMDLDRGYCVCEQHLRVGSRIQRFHPDGKGSIELTYEYGIIRPQDQPHQSDS